jgi:hypothetical protein
MGSSTSCHYSSFGSNNGCTSYPSDSVLSAGAIAGIVIGSLLGIAVIIFLLVLTYKLLKRNSSSSHVPHYPNVYSVPSNRDTYRQSIRRSEMHTPSKPPMYFEPSMNNEFYENA